MFLNNRYYDPTMGNFVSVDPLVGKTGTPYLYGNGNPATLSDPSGLCGVGLGTSVEDFDALSACVAATSELIHVCGDYCEPAQAEAVMTFSAGSPAEWRAENSTDVVQRYISAAEAKQTKAARLAVLKLLYMYGDLWLTAGEIEVNGLIFAFGLGGGRASTRAGALPDGEMPVGEMPVGELSLGEVAAKAESAIPDLSASEQRAVNSLEQRVAEHQAKLEAYQEDPFANDNLGILERAPSAEIQQSIIDGRIRHLQNEIQAFQDQIDKLLGGRS